MKCCCPFVIFLCRSRQLYRYLHTNVQDPLVAVTARQEKCKQSKASSEVLQICSRCTLGLEFT